MSKKVIVFGMSCSGKTTYSKTLDLEYVCFDYLFHWHLIESFGFSASGNLEHIRDECLPEDFVLDGWHLSDKEGEYFPKNVEVHLVWAPYKTIIEQYRIPVIDKNEHLPMYKKWYFDINYEKFNCKYFLNDGEFLQISREIFLRYR